MINDGLVQLSYVFRNWDGVLLKENQLAARITEGPTRVRRVPELGSTPIKFAEKQKIISEGYDYPIAAGLVQELGIELLW